MSTDVLCSLGFASGSIREDAWAIRYFAFCGMEMAVAQSFAKNFGLYGERVGTLHILVSSEELCPNVLSQLCYYQRGEVSTPPAFGAKIVSKILRTPHLREEYFGNLAFMANRIKQMRRRLYEELCRLNTPGNWELIIEQVRSTNTHQRADIRLGCSLILGSRGHRSWN